MSKYILFYILIYNYIKFNIKAYNKCYNYLNPGASGPFQIDSECFLPILTSQKLHSIARFFGACPLVAAQCYSSATGCLALL